MTFGSIDHSAWLARIVTSDARVRTAANGVALPRLPKKKENTPLVDQFVWCRVCSWTHIGDSDYDEFLDLKDIRNDIAHGRIAEPSAGSVDSIERLAAKLQARDVGVVGAGTSFA